MTDEQKRHHTYLTHLWRNWQAAGHAARDAVAHFIHGLIPGIRIKHHGPKEG